MTQPILCIAGKGQAAVDVIRDSAGLGLRCVCIPNADDSGGSGWQPSLLQTARDAQVEIVTLDWAMEQPGLIFLSVEYDRIIRPALFVSDKLFNIHFSLLPKGRGCFTSVWPILHGDAEHGVTLHQIDAGVDTGPIIDQRRFEIEEWMTSRDLYFKCMELGAKLLIEWLPRLVRGDYQAVQQSGEGATLYRRRDIDFQTAAEVDFRQPTAYVLRQIRAFTFPEYQLPTAIGAEIVAAGPVQQGRRAPSEIIKETADGAVWLVLR